MNEVNEIKRIQNLKSYGILDSSPEDSFDEITQKAAKICDCPIALISLVDENRQWFKSHYGIDNTETPRYYSFCSHAIRTPEIPFVINDATKDHRFSENPFVLSKPNIKFYAGIPLVSPEGYALGTLCVINTYPKTISNKKLNSLKALSHQVMQLMNEYKQQTA